MVIAWYPTLQASGATASYLPGRWQQAVDHDNGGVLGILAHTLASIRTHGYENATPAHVAGGFPLVIFEPGFGRISADYTAIAEDLASEGYIVLSSSPTYMSDLVVFNDGRAIRASTRAALPENVPALSPQFTATADRLLRVWEGDVEYLIDQADRLNADPRSAFHGDIDTASVGVVGHSFGGDAAYQVCKADPRCRVAIDLDGTLFGDKGAGAVPLLFLSSDHSRARGDDQRENDYNQSILAAQKQPTYLVTLKGAAHFNFSDLALRSPVVYRLLGAVGSIDGREALSVINQYIDDVLGNTNVAYTLATRSRRSRS